MKIAREQFFNLQKTLPRIPFTQASGWNESLGPGTKVDYFIDSEKEPAIAVWGRRFHLPFLGNILQILGEATNQPRPETVTAFYEDIFAQGYAMVLVSSVAAPSADLEIAMRKAGFVRPYGFTLCPLSILVNIAEPEDRHRAWRKNLKKAEKEELKFDSIEHLTGQDCAAFAAMFAEMSQCKHMHYTVDAETVSRILKDPDFRLFFVRDAQGVPQAGRIAYIHGDYADDVYAANANTARNNGASYFILEKIFQYLSPAGVKTFDFGRIAPGLGEVNSVYEFKMFSGGAPVQYNGEWVRTRSKYVDLAYLIYRQYLKHGARY